MPVPEDDAGHRSPGATRPQFLQNYYVLRTKLTFKDLGMEDLGIYSCDVTDTDGIASSYLIDEEGKFKLIHSLV